MRWLAAVALLLTVPATAMLPAAPAPEEPAEASTPAQTIDDTQDEGADARIQSRIADIFGELPAFQAVEVAVNEGVVTLSGVVPAQEDIARAETIAGRVSGVVTVENGLTRDMSISAKGSGLASLAKMWKDFIALLPLIGLALAVWAGIALVGYLIASLGTLWRRLAPNSFLAELIASAIRFASVVGGLILALDIIGAGALLSAVLGGSAVIGLALGFALRDTIENYVASLFLSLRQPFRANDWVRIDDHEGRIIRLTSRATVMMTLDGNHLRIPNSQVFKAVILNFTRNPQRRFEFDLGVDSDDDVRAARRLARDTLDRLPFILSEPRPEVRVVEVGESAVIIRVLGWIDQTKTDWFRAQTLAIPVVKEALEGAGFSLPEAIYRIRFDERSASVPLVNPDVLPSPPPPPAPPPIAAELPTIEEESRETAATDDIAQMVEAERAEALGDQQNDLLDNSRPVE